MMKKEDNNNNQERSFSSVFHSNGINVTRIAFVRSKNDILDPDSVKYKPSFCHQIYNSNETIFGYKGLSVNIYYDAKTMNCYLDINYFKKINEKSKKNVDDVENMLSRWLPNGYTTNRSRFISRLNAKKSSRMFGKELENFTKEMTGRGECHFKISETSVKDRYFKNLHQRFQTVITWYIESASFIDLNDPKWKLFYLFEHKDRCHYPVGFCSIYHFYRYPDKIRARISQFFIIPSHQRSGLGTKLLKTIYKHIWKQNEIVDITVEDPSGEFQRMRDYVDCNLLIDFDLFNFNSVIEKPYRKNVVDINVESCYKICSKQCRRIYEILNLFYVGQNKESLIEWCRRIRKRLMLPYERDMKVYERKNFNFYYKSLLLNRNQKYAKPNQYVDTRFRKYIDEIVPTIHKLQKCKNVRTPKLIPSNVKKIWSKLNK